MIDRKRLIRLTQELVRINSENPPGDERAVAGFVFRFLKKIGLRPRVVRFARRRDNVLAILKGKRRGGALLLTPHLDTVPAGGGWRFGPFSGVVSRGRIYGRGATDCKGNVAVSLEALASIVEDGAPLEHDVIWLGSADEETGSGLGILPFLEKKIINPAYALILDSDAFKVVVAQKGLIHFKVKVLGRRAHGAYPGRGINAIEAACRLITVLKGMKFSYRPHRYLKPPTVNIGTIRGGDKVNMVADQCAFEADLRFLPGMDAALILQDIRRAFRTTKARFAVEVNDIQKPYEIDASHLLVRALKEASRGIAPECRASGSEGATVITFFQKRGIPAVATGYGSAGCAHATDEYVAVDDLVRGARVLEKFIETFDAR